MGGGWRERGGAKLPGQAEATIDEVHGMRRLGRQMGWLGWVVAGVLAISAGGMALAATGQATSTTSTVTGPAKKDGAGLAGHWGGRLGRRALHGEVTLQTRDGVKTVVFARGKVTAVSDSSITITSSDNVATTFALNADTSFGTRRHQQAKSDVKVGVEAAVGGLKSGSGATASRVVVRTGAKADPKGP